MLFYLVDIDYCFCLCFCCAMVLFLLVVVVCSLFANFAHCIVGWFVIFTIW